MPKLQAVYAKEEDIPEGFADLYSERNQKWEITGVEGIKTQADVDRIDAALKKERGDHKESKSKLAKYGDLDPETISATQAELEETKAKLEAIAPNGKLDETKVQPMIEAAVKRAIGPLEREKTQLQRDLDNARKTQAEREAEVAALNQSIRNRSIEAALRDEAVKAKVLGSAVEDVVALGAAYFELTDDDRILTKDAKGQTPGLNPKEWLKDMQDKRAHWWPVSQGGGAHGGRGGGTGRSGNPWAAENWNVSAQGRYVTEHGIEKAQAAAAAMGVKVGDTKPAKRAA